MAGRPPTRYSRPLRALLHRRLHEPFAWGSRDCASLVLDALEAVTGRPVGQGIRGRWCNALGAARVLHELGGWDGLAARCWGAEVPPADAREGDVVLLGPELCRGGLAGAGALGVCLGGPAARVVVSQGERGLVSAPLSAARRAWRAA